MKRSEYKKRSFISYLLKVLFKFKFRFAKFVPEITMEQSRRNSEKIASSFSPLTIVEKTDVTIQGVRAAWFKPVKVSEEQRMILYFHGGSYCQGSISTHSSMTSNIASSSNTPLLSVEYRLAPENPFPAALEDAFAVYLWLIENKHKPAEITLAGDSSGAGLALALLYKLRELKQPFPAGCVCIYPWTNLLDNDPERVERESEDFILNRRELFDELAVYYIGNEEAKNPLVSPLYGSPEGFPPLLIQTGTSDILHSDAVKFARLADDADVDVTLDIWHGMPHGWHMAAKMLPEARAALASIAEFVNRVKSPVLSND